MPVNASLPPASLSVTGSVVFHTSCRSALSSSSSTTPNLVTLNSGMRRRSLERIPPLLPARRLRSWSASCWMAAFSPAASSMVPSRLR
ncbi:hypothetical protein CH063_08539 [Colletotrichum higginsianum]|uniref:Uncharacterized protein n=1 Tax=Colletotrichum higginsianum (strain IMI 349063) TaxID=759273 RepID=H1VA74_COLHI|nr:hypothetical protein CH063_08539 [Colletotrichum higginsianum]